MSWRRAVLVLLLVLYAAAGARAQELLRLEAQQEVNLAPYLAWLEDPSGRLALADVLRQQERFRPLPGRAPGANFGLTTSAVWLRVRVATAPGSAADWLLELAYPPLDHVELYVPDAQGGGQRQASSDLLPFASRPLAHRNHVLPLQLLPGRESVIYLRIASEGTLAAPLRLWRPAALWRADQAAYAALALYFGLLVGLLLYNLLLYLSVRDTAYLVYVLFVAGMALAQAAITGLGYQFVWPRQPWWNSVSPPAGFCLAATFGLLFARRFLGSAEAMPLLDRLLLALAAGWSLALLAALGLPYAVSSWLVTVLAPVSVAVLVASGITALRRGHGGARHYLAAWALLLAGVLVLFLHNTGLIPSNPFTANALLIGSAAEMLLLSFALADRIKASHQARERERQRLAAEHAMVEALSQSQQRLRTVLEEREVILENSIVGICFLTAQGRLRWANRAMLEMFKAGGRAVDSMEPFYTSREQYLEVGAEVAAAAARGEVYRRELQVRQYDGTPLWILLSGKAVSPQNLEHGTVWAIMDITRRKQLEEQLQHTMSEREAILNNAVVGIVLSVRRRHEWVNAKFAQMMGYPREQLVGRLSDYIHPDREAWERFGVEARAALIATGSYTCELQLQRADGALFWVEMGGSCIRHHDPDSGVIWTFLDVTGRKKSEAEIRAALEQQKALNALRTRFVAMTSHEFRTPLAAILSAAELLRHYRLPEAERLETLDGIAAGVQRMSRMLDRVLLLGRADARMLEFSPGEVDLRALCGTLVEEARLQHPQARATVRCALAPEVGSGRYDEKLLRHILVNLLSNAIKYSPDGGEVVFSIAYEGGDTVFRVRDPGIGIAPEEIPHLFEAFHRAGNVGDIPGTGLGLAIVKNAVEMHGGRIAVESRPGAGTTFTVRIPAAPAAGRVSEPPRASDPALLR